jgi:hypothetical protein
MDDLLSKAEAEALFAPHVVPITDCLNTAWDAWTEVSRSTPGRRLGKSARARIVWDHATSRAVDVFGPDPSIGKMTIRGLPVFDFGRAMLRFKKLDRTLQTRGIETRQQQIFANQEQVEHLQMSLWRPVPMVIAGYILDRLEQSIERRLLVLLRRGQVVWAIDLPATASGMPAAIPSPTEPPAGRVPRSLRVVRREHEAE